MIVKKLAEKFKSHGVHYRLVERTGDVAIYSLRYGECSQIIGYDAVRVSRTTLERYNGLIRDSSRKIQGNYDDVVESYPSSNQWGTYAWSFTTFPAARVKYFELVNLEKHKALEAVTGHFHNRGAVYTFGGKK